MHPQRVAGLCLWIVVSSVAVAAQQRSDTAGTSPTSSTIVTERTYQSTGVLPLRRVERRTASGGRKGMIETVEALGIEGNWEPVEETVTDAGRTGSGGPAKAGAYAQRDVFRFDLQHRRTLAETTESEVTRANGSTRNVQRTWIADLDGRLTLSSGYIEETTLTSRSVQQTDETRSRLSIEGSLQGTERWQSTEQQVNSAVVRHDSAYLVRDVNGQWLLSEARSGESRGIGSVERVEEEAIQRQNLTEVVGALALSDKVVTRTSESSAGDRVVIETYSQDAEGFVRNDNHLALRQRVSRSTTATAGGGRSIIEEIEERNPMAPNDPMHVTQRTVVSVRSSGRGGWVTERQIFERDQNGRMFLVTKDTEVATEK